MAEIVLNNIAHSYVTDPIDESAYALRPLQMTWQDGGAYALLGPSGCGKTTLLNIISGLIHPTRGSILFDGVDVTELPPERRNIAQVFQFPVIYDTMSVFDNLAFPLRNRGVAAKEVRNRVGEVAELLDLTADLRRRAAGLSADAKQKISLGRGLVRSDVAAILFDEPLTVIDPHMKWLLRSKLKEIHQQYKLTLIYVTHDQTEALTFADQVVVMVDGSVVQVGTPQELFEAPAHTFVGYFIGSPGMNLLQAHAADGQVMVGDTRLPIAAPTVNGPLTVGIRPEFLGYSATPQPDGVPAEVVRIEDLGNYKILTAQLANQQVKIKVAEEETVQAGPGWLLFSPTYTKLYQNDKVID